MNDTHLLRAAAVDLLSFAAAEEQALLTATAGSEGETGQLGRRTPFGA